ncbi:MAG: zinc-ribbon domain-containing protein [Mogibacterium sp.]|nr:zinc-ribbon domain-containing protein [Mogibacterium sp.]
MKNAPLRKVCANCHNAYVEGDKYCRYCGAPLGTPKFIEEEFSCIYGPPPVQRVHTCTKCGFSWSTCLMIDDEHWCPKCGAAAPVTAVESDYDGVPVQPE